MKIKIIKCNLKNESILLQGVEILKKWTDSIYFPLDITYSSSTSYFEGVPFDNSADTNNGASQGYMVAPLSIPIDETVDITALLYDWTKVFPQPTNPVQNPIKKGKSTVIQIPEQFYDIYPEVCAQYLLHEIIHGIYFLLGKASEDRVHYKYTIDSFSQKQDYEYYLYLLQGLIPAWNKYSAPVVSSVVIKRISDDGVQTLGELTYGTFKCKTLERPWKGNKINISCIPKGTYIANYTFSPKFMKYTYQIMNVPGRAGIRIHSGNFFFDLLGCIALGDSYKDINNDKKVDVINSRITIAKFEQLLDKKSFTLTIK